MTLMTMMKKLNYLLRKDKPAFAACKARAEDSAATRPEVGATTGTAVPLLAGPGAHLLSSVGPASHAGPKTHLSSTFQIVQFM